LIAAVALAEHGIAETEAETNRTVAAVMRTVGEQLGNTPAVAQASCVSPAVVEQYLDGRTIDDFDHVICGESARAISISTSRSDRC
jgi:DNA topoisomerase-1